MHATDEPEKNISKKQDASYITFTGMANDWLNVPVLIFSFDPVSVVLQWSHYVPQSAAQ